MAKTYKGYFRKVYICKAKHVEDFPREVCPVCGETEFRSGIARTVSKGNLKQVLISWEERLPNGELHEISVD